MERLIVDLLLGMEGQPFQVGDVARVSGSCARGSGCDYDWAAEIFRGWGSG